MATAELWNFAGFQTCGCCSGKACWVETVPFALGNPGCPRGIAANVNLCLPVKTCIEILLANSRRRLFVAASSVVRALLFVWFFGAAQAHAQGVSILRASPSRVEPNADSLHVSLVRRGETGMFVEGQSPWFRVQVNGETGWLFITEFVFSRVEISQVRHGGAGGTGTLGVRCFLPCSPWQHALAHGSDISERQLALLDSYAASQENAARPKEPLPAISPSKPAFPNAPNLHLQPLFAR